MQKRGELSKLGIVFLIGCIVVLFAVVAWIIFKVEKNIQDEFDDSNLDLKISEVKSIDDSKLNVSVKRNTGDGEFIGLSFAVSDGSVTEIIKVNTSMSENETESFSLVLNYANASKIKILYVSPIYLNEEGYEVAGNIKDEYLAEGCVAYCPYGAQCGSDGCEGNCGSGCNSGYSCINYKCVKSSSGSSGGGGGGSSSEEDGDETVPCTDTCLSLGYACGTRTICGSNIDCGNCTGGYSCAVNGTCIEGICSSHASFNCSGGDVYWWNSCGQIEEIRYDCNSTQTCTNGQCVNNCIANCVEKECGDDGCGGSCGTCSGSEVCNAGQCEATTYLRTFYISNSGNDNNDGLSESTPWKTIAKINGRTFQPGDAILFERGGVWRETLEVPSGGNSTHYLTFGNYGSGANPRILGSKAGATWTNQGGNIWKSDVTFSNPDVAEVVFRNSDGSGRFGIKKSNTGGLTAEYNWVYSSSYIYVYSATDPSTRYSEIEIPQRNYCVSTNDKPYLHFNGIDVLYCGYTGYDSNNDHTISDVNGMIIENCEVGFIGGQSYDDIGFGIATIYSDMIIRNNKIYHCGRRGIALDVYNEGSKFTVENILVEGNRLYNGYHTTGVDIDVGAVGSSNINNLVIRNNWMYEESTHTSDFSNFIFIQNNYVSGCDITNIYIYNNIFQRANGAGVMAEGIEGPIYIYNNVFYDHDPNAESWMAYIMPQTKDGQRSNSIVKNNIFHGGAGTRFTAMEVWGSWNQHDYNLFYNAGSFSESNGVNGDPLFVNAAAGNFHLQSTSPAINKGTDVSSIRAVDYEGNPIVGLPDIGAFEYS